MKLLKRKVGSDNALKESELIKRILSGEKELYEILVRRNNQKLYRVIRGYLNNEEEIEDAMQNAYLNAYEKLYQFKLNATFSTWLIRIGINEALARLREKKRSYTADSENGEYFINLTLELPDNKQPNPQKNMIKKETKQLLEDAIDQLDLKYRTVYIMKEVEGLSVKEVALALDLTESNVKVRLHRSRAMLKEILYELSVDKSIFEFGFGRCDRITERVMEKL
ncbi:RNA polymerase sigma factor [Membranicola marinus]|uniref:RNA polymerase sigma factor n=1 Tax=Membranihabitans marinus TaxID=1227546 RepID=A0A953HWV8_9BACT|nr:RNA polymerase sigma factor [Membranihabitans marinus]MBY5957242.1 RNA polymerase sigma factor [Membranihabitans marinus]